MTQPYADIQKLETELAELTAANEAATSWGAAVGARSERIKDIERQLRAGNARAYPGHDELAEIYRLLGVKDGETALDVLRAHPDWMEGK